MLVTLGNAGNACYMGNASNMGNDGIAGNMRIAGKGGNTDNMHG